MKIEKIFKFLNIEINETNEYITLGKENGFEILEMNSITEEFINKGKILIKIINKKKTFLEDLEK
jgi:hypothetical protein